MYKYLNVCNLYITSNFLYLLQGSIYPSESILSKLFLGISSLISIYYWYLANKLYKLPTLLKVLNIFILILFTHAIIYQLGGDFLIQRESVYTGIAYINRLIYSLLPIFPCYVFTRKGMLNEISIRICFFILLIAVTTSFYVNERTIIESKTYIVDGITNNISYDFVALLPLLFLFWRKPIILYLTISYILLFVILGMKRGAILITIITLFYVIYHTMKNISLRNKLLMLFGGIIICYVFGNYILDMLNTNEYFLYRIEQTIEGDSSGRNEIYSFFLNYFFMQSDILHIILGGGTFHTIRILGLEAHNDWFEILICYGLFGVIVYFIFWHQVFICYKHSNIMYKRMFMLFFIINIMKTLFSMGYEGFGFCSLISLGYCLGRRDLELSL